MTRTLMETGFIPEPPEDDDIPVPEVHVTLEDAG